MKQTETTRSKVLMKGFKGTYKNVRCSNNFQYEVGKTYMYDGTIELCGAGYHFCKELYQVFSYYPVMHGHRYFEVEVIGNVIEGDDKCVTDGIRITREIPIEYVVITARQHNMLSVSELLAAWPQFIDNCDISRLTAAGWETIISSQPQLEDKCPWDSMKCYNFVKILGAQPQFINKCSKAILSSFCSHQILDVLSKQPDLAKYFNMSKLEDRDIGLLLGVYPYFSAFVDLSKMSSSTWADLLITQPRFADCCDFNRFTGIDWVTLLWWCTPQLAAKCDWSKLTSRDWYLLLSRKPEFHSKCKMHELHPDDVRALLMCQPQLAEFCDLTKLDSYSWRELLIVQPTLALKCPLENISADDFAAIIINNPVFADIFDWKNCSSEISETALAELLYWRPEMIGRLDFSKEGFNNAEEYINAKYKNISHLIKHGG